MSAPFSTKGWKPSECGITLLSMKCNARLPSDQYEPGGHPAEQEEPKVWPAFSGKSPASPQTRPPVPRERNSANQKTSFFAIGTATAERSWGVRRGPIAINHVRNLPRGLASAIRSSRRMVRTPFFICLFSQPKVFEGIDDARGGPPLPRLRHRTVRPRIDNIPFEWNFEKRKTQKLPQPSA